MGGAACKHCRLLASAVLYHYFTVTCTESILNSFCLMIMGSAASTRSKPASRYQSFIMCLNPVEHCLEVPIVRWYMRRRKTAAFEYGPVELSQMTLAAAKEICMCIYTYTDISFYTYKYTHAISICICVCMYIYIYIWEGLADGPLPFCGWVNSTLARLNSIGAD